MIRSTNVSLERERERERESRESKVGGISVLQKFKCFICMPKSLSKEAHANCDKECGL